jgi:hypothetical protein
LSRYNCHCRWDTGNPPAIAPQRHVRSKHPGYLQSWQDVRSQPASSVGVLAGGPSTLRDQSHESLPTAMTLLLVTEAFPTAVCPLSEIWALPMAVHLTPVTIALSVREPSSLSSDINRVCLNFSGIKLSLASGEPAHSPCLQLCLCCRHPRPKGLAEQCCSLAFCNVNLHY